MGTWGRCEAWEWASRGGAQWEGRRQEGCRGTCRGFVVSQHQRGPAMGWGAWGGLGAQVASTG